MIYLTRQFNKAHHSEHTNSLLSALRSGETEQSRPSLTWSIMSSSYVWTENFTLPPQLQVGPLACQSLCE